MNFDSNDRRPLADTPMESVPLAPVHTEIRPDRTDRTVLELMATWPKKRFAFGLAQELSGYALGMILSLVAVLALTVTLLVGGRTVYFDFASDGPTPDERPGGVTIDRGDRPFADGKEGNARLPWAEQVSIIPASAIKSEHAALADLGTGQIIASRRADETIYPASMTKVMTLIVVVENLPSEDSLKDTIIISREVYDNMRREGSSGIGMEPGEKLSVESLLYALMLRSDGIAACELARYVAGSEADFVELMNQKAEKMGLSNTHFENATGLHHANHKSTAREIASIMSYAMNMSLCRRILKTQSFNAPFTMTDGQEKHYFLTHNLIVTQFEKITPNQPDRLSVVAGKTGFTDESRYCLVTYAESPDGHGYVCVTVSADSYATCIADYIAVYNAYANP